MPQRRPDDIISYHEVVHAEKATVQKGMNYDFGRGYSVFLMSVRKGLAGDVSRRGYCSFS